VVRIAVVLLGVLLWCPVSRAQGPELLDPAKERRLALDAEKAQDWGSALAHWENLNDSCEIDPILRLQVVARIHDLRPKVPVDPDQRPGNVWKCLALVYRNVDFEWKDKDGKPQHIVTTMSDADVETLRSGFESFRNLVLAYSGRELDLAYDVRVVERPLKQLIGEGSFWLDPAEAAKDMDDVAQDECDSVFTYTRYQQAKDGAAIPAPFAGGTLGGDLGPKGAGYTHIILWAPNLEPGGRTGEIELHEWLHQVDWMFSAVQGYPDDVVPTPDGGRMEGDFGGDPDYRRRPEEKTWLPFYRHIMQDHITRAMWRNASMHRVAETPWSATMIGEWLVLGPFEKVGGNSFATPFIDEETIEPYPTMRTSGKVWRLCRAEGFVLNLDRILSPNENVVAYAHVYVHSDKEQAAQLRIGSDDGAAVWDNGRLIYCSEVPRGLTRDQNSVDVMLKQGWNRFLFKVDEISGGWGLAARFTDTDGRPLPGIRTAVRPDGDGE
jgi:hypothetical protein